MTGHLAPDFKRIADYRRGKSEAIRNVMAQYQALGCPLNLRKSDVKAIEAAARNTRREAFLNDAEGELNLSFELPAWSIALLSSVDD